MSGPEHLWSGDWERESASTRPAPAAEGPPVSQRPVDGPEQGTDPSARSRRSPAVAGLLVLAVLAVVAGVAIGLGAGGDRSAAPGRASVSPPPSATQPTSPQSALPPNTGQPTVPPATVPQATVPQLTIPQLTVPPQATPPTSPQPSAPQAGTTTGSGATQVAGPAVYWDGMQIEATYPGVVMIVTVKLGSPAESAGLDPGYRLLAVNGHQLNDATDIARAISGLHAGGQVKVQVLNGSSSARTVSLTLGAPPSGHP